MRGKLYVCKTVCKIDRITPAGAGKTWVFGVLGCVRWDHPRRCGENKDKPTKTAAAQGSPPQVRGKRCPLVLLRTALRITPAGAGKTSCLVFAPLPLRDHPRRCGENGAAAYVNCLQGGSPPQVRGKPMRAAAAALLRGITPAGAGKTHLRIVPKHIAWDHPRRCGENRAHSPRRAQGGGSPPQVRGKRRACSCPIGTPRITPAGAGKTTR